MNIGPMIIWSYGKSPLGADGTQSWSAQKINTKSKETNTLLVVAFSFQGKMPDHK